MHYQTVKIDGINIFYREAGAKDAPTLLLLHGFPTSSQQYRNLIPALADKYHVIAPDYPGFGRSAMPAREDFDYSFASYASLMEGFTQNLKLDSYSLYVMDYGAPVGYRLALKAPEKVNALIIQTVMLMMKACLIFGMFSKPTGLIIHQKIVRNYAHS